MDRLTKTYSDGTFGIADDLPVGENSWAFKGLLINQLGQYENTGLTPSEVIELVKAKTDERIEILTQEQKEAKERLANYSADDRFFDDEYC